MRQNKTVTKYPVPQNIGGKTVLRKNAEVRHKAKKENMYYIGARRVKEYWPPFYYIDEKSFVEEVSSRALDCDVNNEQLDNWAYLALDFSFYYGQYLVKVTEKDDTMGYTKYLVTVGDAWKPGRSFSSVSFRVPRTMAQPLAMHGSLFNALFRAIELYEGKD